jgi:glycosyltransferase involved in cell wall biosynthesis
MAYGRRTRDLIRGGDWDLIHCWEEPYVFAGYQIARWTPASTPFVFWTAQNLSKRYPPPFCWFEQYCVRRAAGWLACGQTTVNTQLRRGYGTKPHRVMPLGVDMDVFRPDRSAGEAVRRQLGWAAMGPPVVGFLGRFVAEKGVKFLTRVLDEVKVPWRALFVGGGPLEIEVRHWAEQYGDRVRVATRVPHALVPAYLNAMDVLAAPSQTIPRWAEQLGRMLIEAFAAGVAVVGSDSGEIPYVIAEAGRVAAESSVADWAAVIGQLLDSPAARAELAALGRGRAEAEFAWPTIAHRHLDFFDELTGCPQPAPAVACG